MPHYDRHSDASAPQNDFETVSSNALDDETVQNAAGALRETEVEAAQEEPDASSIDAANLDQMNIDELRAIARQLDIPDRVSITEQDDLIAEIRKRL
jgi:hypothetical protein